MSANRASDHKNLIAERVDHAPAGHPSGAPQRMKMIGQQATSFSRPSGRGRLVSGAVSSRTSVVRVSLRTPDCRSGPCPSGRERKHTEQIACLAGTSVGFSKGFGQLEDSAGRRMRENRPPLAGSPALAVGASLRGYEVGHSGKASKLSFHFPSAWVRRYFPFGPLTTPISARFPSARV